MLVHTNQAKCVAAGTCAAVAPAVFDQDDDSGIVKLLNEHPPESERSAVEEAVEFCPAQAISIEED
ncbi:MAG TPA: ferredoxin [Mycobacterium sp.]